MDINLTDLIIVYKSYRLEHKDLVLATLIETEGSTYRKPGARMLIDSESNCYGFFGMEFKSDICTQARQVFLDHDSVVCTYDSRSGSSWETGQDSNGLLRILFEYIPPDDDFSTMAIIEKAISLGKKMILATVIESNIEDLTTGDKIGIVDGEIFNPFPEKYIPEICDTAYQILSAGKPSLESIIMDSGSFNIFFDVVKPPFHMLIIGTGADTQPLAKLAKFTGWRVTQTDYQDNRSIRELDVEIDRYIICAPEDLLQEIDSVSVDAVIIMTHKYDYDLRYLQQLATTDISYIGLLGPAAKRDKLLSSLSEEGQQIQERVYGPVGLDIGAELPEEVAISIIAEIKAASRGRSAGFLSRQPLQTTAKKAVNDRLYALVLAAGGSYRFGGIKQLVELQGKSLLRRAVDSAQEILNDRVIVILGIKAKKLERELKGYDVQIVHNPNWENGIASSIRSGISTLPVDCNGVLIIFCDQPFITPSHLIKLIENWNRDQTRIVAGSYAGTIGVPAIIPSKYFPEMMKLTGDRGAKSILLDNTDSLITVDIPEAEVDIDTQSDLIDAINRISV